MGSYPLGLILQAKGREASIRTLTRAIDIHLACLYIICIYTQKIKIHMCTYTYVYIYIDAYICISTSICGAVSERAPYADPMEFKGQSCRAFKNGQYYGLIFLMYPGAPM